MAKMNRSHEGHPFCFFVKAAKNSLLMEHFTYGSAKIA